MMCCRLSYDIHTRYSQPFRQAMIQDLFEQIFKNIDDVLWKEAGCSSELEYTGQSS